MILSNEDVIARQKYLGASSGVSVRKDHYFGQGQNNYRQEPPQYNHQPPQAVCNNSPYLSFHHFQRHQNHDFPQQQQQQQQQQGTANTVVDLHIENMYLPVGYRNEEAIQELEENPQMVLSQRQPSSPREHFQQQQEKEHSLLRFKASRPDQGQEQPSSAVDCKMAPRQRQYDIFTTSQPSFSGPRSEIEEYNSVTNNDSKDNKFADSKMLHDFSIEVLNTSTNRSNSANRLITLGSELQPLSLAPSYTNNPMKNQAESCLLAKKSSSLPSSSSNDAAGLYENDTMMNKLFHSELKMSIIINNDTNQNSMDVNRESVKRASSYKYDTTEGKSSTGQTMINNGNKRKTKEQTLKKRKFSRILTNDEHNSNDCGMLTTTNVPANVRGGKITVGRPKKKLRRPSKQKKKNKNNTKEKNDPEEEPLSLSIEEQISTLPATVLSPSVLASIVMNEQQPQRRISSSGESLNNQNAANDGTSTIKDNKKTTPLSPQNTFDEILKVRGYSNLYSIDAEETDYDTVPSPLQLASYGKYFIWAVQTSNVRLLSDLLSCGLSPNACNQFRDSILCDLVCKKGNVPAYKCLVNEFNADLQVVDGFGRTLLHHCCWSHSLSKEIVTDILCKDPIQIFIKDKHGNTPLEYVRVDGYKIWNEFLNEISDTYWPVGGRLPIVCSPKDRRINGNIVDPPNALVPREAAGVSSGTITPEVAKLQSLARATLTSSENE